MLTKDEVKGRRDFDIMAINAAVYGLPVVGILLSFTPLNPLKLIEYAQNPALAKAQRLEALALKQEISELAMNAKRDQIAASTRKDCIKVILTGGSEWSLNSLQPSEQIAISPNKSGVLPPIGACVQDSKGATGVVRRDESGVLVVKDIVPPPNQN